MKDKKIFRPIFLLFLQWLSCLCYSQTYIKGTVRYAGKKSTHIAITNFNAQRFETLDDCVTVRSFGEDSAVHFFDSVQAETPTILQLQVNNAIYFVFANPGDSLLFTIEYKDDVTVSREDHEKWNYFPNQQAVSKASKIFFKGQQKKANAFLNKLQNKHGLLRRPRQYFDGVKLLDYSSGIRETYHLELGELTSFCKNNGVAISSPFYTLSRELIIDNYIRSLCAPVFFYRSKDSLPPGYFAGSEKKLIGDMLSTPSSSFFLKDAKWVLNVCYLPDAITKTTDAVLYNSWFSTAKKYFKDTADLNYITSAILDHMVTWKYFIQNDSLISDYARTCTNKTYVQNILQNYYNKKGYNPDLSINMVEILSANHFLDADSFITNIVAAFPKDKFILLDFWATWCGPCTANIPLLHNALKNTSWSNQVFVIGISVDEDIKKWQTFIQQNTVNYFPVHQQFLLKNSFNSDLAKSIGLAYIPRYMLLSPDLKVINKNLLQPTDKQNFINAISRAIDNYSASQ